MTKTARDTGGRRRALLLPPSNSHSYSNAPYLVCAIWNGNSDKDASNLNQVTCRRLGPPNKMSESSEMSESSDNKMAQPDIVGLIQSTR